MTKRKPQSLPPSHLDLIREKGFEVLSWQDRAVETAAPDGGVRSEWLPVHLVHWEKRRFAEWVESPTYDFPGWEPQDGSAQGGRYDTVAGALGWFDWLDAQKAKRS